MKIADLPKAVKAIMGDGSLALLVDAESYNIRQAASAIATIAELMSHEGWEADEDPRDVRQLATLLQGLARYLVDEAGEVLAGIGSTATAQAEVEEPGEMAPAMLSTTAEKVLSLSYVKGLHLSHTEQFVRDVVAAKSVGTDRIRAYSHIWGDPKRVDVELDFFTPETDFWDAELKSFSRPLTYDHAQDPDTTADPIVGSIDAFGDDKVGRWYEAQLKRNHQYREAIDRLISDRGLGSSSDSAPQYVIREPQKNGSVWIARWPWFACALTPEPAEPRMLKAGSPVYKSIVERLDLSAIESRMGRRDEPNGRPDSLIADLDLLSI